ncbi:MAG: ABC transporter permease [Mesorhizobium amorphae]|nr:MAG: ABC transporter permease [Mesorhizobium amorphae]
MSAATDTAAAHKNRIRLRVNVGLAVFLVLYVAIAFLQPNYLEPSGFTNFLRRAAPLVILACGQIFVIVAGGFDLSMGSLVTLTVLGAAMATGGDPAMTWPTIALLYAIGLCVGLVNGLVVAKLKVPSIIATLGMLLALNGAALIWSGGSPRGALPENFRMFGRYLFRDVPLVGTLPLAVFVLLAFAGLAGWLLHGTVLGRQVFAVGDNPRAAELSGVAVDRIRVFAFVFSALSAVTGGIMLGGFAGVSTGVGDGLELQAIAACVIGGALLLGGRGSVLGAVFGALSLFALFTLLNLLGLPQPIRDAAQGVILITAVALGAARRRGR